MTDAPPPRRERLLIALLILATAAHLGAVAWMILGS